MSSLFYFFKESLQGFARNLSTTLGSIVTIFLSLLIIGVFLVGGTVINHLVSSIENEVSITAYVADDADLEESGYAIEDVNEDEDGDGFGDGDDEDSIGGDGDEDEDEDF